MKKGSKIEVSENAKYNGQDMEWTETFTGIKRIGKGGEVVTHTSNKEIKKFAAKQICAHPASHSESYFISTISKKELKNRYSWKYFIYSIYLPEGTEVDTYSDDEYRFELTENMEIIFSGTITECNNTEKKGTDTYLKFSDTVKLVK